VKTALKWFNITSSAIFFVLYFHVIALITSHDKSSATAEDGRPYKQLKRLCLHRRCIEYLATGNFYLLA